jgi:exonuclease V
MVNLIEKYRPHGIGVTDLSSQLWCEKQLEFSLERGRILKDEMKKGTERHRELHEEVADLIKVETKTTADRVALILHNQTVGLQRLVLTGMTRELLVWGFVNSLFVRGSVDELNLKNQRLHISDTKTRRSGNMPSEPQKRTTRFQLMIYNKLLHDLVAGDFSANQLLKFYGIKNRTNISDDFKKQVNDIGSLIEPNIRKLAENTFKLFGILPRTEKGMTVRYERQEDGVLIGTDEFLFADEDFQKDCDFVEGFWLGKREARPVGAKNSWKCRYCEFVNDCIGEQKVDTKNQSSSLDNFFVSLSLVKANFGSCPILC